MEVFWRLVSTADVFHNNMRGGVMGRLGVTFETIQQHNPRCIFSSATGWGHLGPDAYTGAMDTLAQARGGFMSVTGEGEDGPPTQRAFLRPTTSARSCRATRSSWRCSIGSARARCRR